MTARNKDSLFARLGNTYTIPTDEESLRKVFNAFDRDGSGSIDFREFAAAYKEFEEELGCHVSTSDIGRRFKGADKDRNNSLDFNEFYMFMLSRASK